MQAVLYLMGNDVKQVSQHLSSKTTNHKKLKCLLLHIGGLEFHIPFPKHVTISGPPSNTHPSSHSNLQDRPLKTPILMPEL